MVSFSERPFTSNPVVFFSTNLSLCCRIILAQTTDYLGKKKVRPYIYVLLALTQNGWNSMSDIKRPYRFWLFITKADFTLPRIMMKRTLKIDERNNDKTFCKGFFSKKWLPENAVTHVISLQSRIDGTIEGQSKLLLWPAISFPAVWISKLYLANGTIEGQSKLLLWLAMLICSSVDSQTVPCKRNVRSSE